MANQQNIAEFPEFPPVEDPVIHELSEIFFQIVKEGSMEKMQEFAETNGLEETVKMANSFNENGETPLLLAISGDKFWMAHYLIMSLNVDITQMGKFLWNGVEYLEGPPLFAAILFESQKTAQFPILDESIVDVLIDAEFPTPFAQMDDEDDDDHDEGIFEDMDDDDLIHEDHDPMNPFAVLLDDDEEMLIDDDDLLDQEMDDVIGEEFPNQINPFAHLDEEMDEIVYPVLESVKNCKTITSGQKVEILELIGSLYILKNESYVLGVYNKYLFCGIECWVEALRLRESDGVPKVSYDLPDYARNILGSENSTELTTLEELDEIIPRNIYKPTDHLDLNESTKDQLHYQAILTSLRILNRFQKDLHPFLFFIRHVINMHLSYLEKMNPFRVPGLFQRIHNLGMRVLLEFTKSEDYEDDSVNAILFSMRWAISMERIRPGNMGLLNFDSVMQVLDFVSDYVDKLPPSAENVEERDSVLHSIYDIVEHSVRHLRKLDEKEKRQFTIWLNHFDLITRVHSDGKSLLHIACHYYHRRNADITEMLLDGGANPNATDENKDTPAHYLAENYRPFDVLASLELLVGAGAHLFQANKSGETAAEKYRERRQHFETVIAESCMEPEMRLTCLCAEVLRKNKIQYDEYPPFLVPFLERHGAKR